MCLRARARASARAGRTAVASGPRPTAPKLARRSARVQLACASKSSALYANKSGWRVRVNQAHGRNVPSSPEKEREGSGGGGGGSGGGSSSSSGGGGSSSGIAAVVPSAAPSPRRRPLSESLGPAVLGLARTGWTSRPNPSESSIRVVYPNRLSESSIRVVSWAALALVRRRVRAGRPRGADGAGPRSGFDQSAGRAGTPRHETADFNPLGKESPISIPPKRNRRSQSPRKGIAHFNPSEKESPISILSAAPDASPRRPLSGRPVAGCPPAVPRMHGYSDRRRAAAAGGRAGGRGGSSAWAGAECRAGGA